MAANDPLLVLWDIDHTLIETRGAGRAIYERVFPEVTGQPLRELATVHGRTELDIIHDTLEAHGIAPTTEAVAELAAALAAGYRAALDELTSRGRILPGVLDVLRYLAADPQIQQSVLTGNTTEIAEIKTDAFGLTPYLNLAIGAYGDDHRDRAELVTIACKRANEQLGNRYKPDHITLIGDTPNDVEAALDAGAHVIGVATGKFTTADLRAAGATAVFETLPAPGRIRDVL